MEYRDKSGRQRRKRRRERGEEKRWASMAGPVEVRRLDVNDRGEAGDDEGERSTGAEVDEDQDQG